MNNKEPKQVLDLCKEHSVKFEGVIHDSLNFDISNSPTPKAFTMEMETLTRSFMEANRIPSFPTSYRRQT